MAEDEDEDSEPEVASSLVRDASSLSPYASRMQLRASLTSYLAELAWQQRALVAYRMDEDEAVRARHPFFPYSHVGLLPLRHVGLEKSKKVRRVMEQRVLALGAEVGSDDFNAVEQIDLALLTFSSMRALDILSNNRKQATEWMGPSGREGDRFIPFHQLHLGKEEEAMVHDLRLLQRHAKKRREATAKPHRRPQRGGNDGAKRKTEDPTASQDIDICSPVAGGERRERRWEQVVSTKATAGGSTTTTTTTTTKETTRWSRGTRKDIEADCGLPPPPPPPSPLPFPLVAVVAAFAGDACRLVTPLGMVPPRYSRTSGMASGNDRKERSDGWRSEAGSGWQKTRTKTANRKWHLLW